MKMLVINGPNINMLGVREPELYGRKTYADLIEMTEATGRAENVELEFYQSNHEGCLVDKIQEAYRIFDGIIINPAAYTHTSVAILDAIKAVGIPAVEVHISDLKNRENFRQTSYVREACICTVSGKGLTGYSEAMQILKEHILKMR